MTKKNETREQKAARDNHANQLNPNHMPTKDADHPMRQEGTGQAANSKDNASGEER